MTTSQTVNPSEIYRLNLRVLALWTGWCALMALYPHSAGADWPRALVRIAVVLVPTLLFLRSNQLNLGLWPVSWRAVAIGMLIVAGYFAVGVWIFRPNSFTFPTDPIVILNWVIATPIAEELLYRGITYQQLAKAISHHRAALISAASFLLLHIPRWVFMGRITTIDGVRFLLSVAVFGLLLPYLIRSTNSLWSAIAVHVTNNFFGRALQ